MGNRDIVRSNDKKKNKNSGAPQSKRWTKKRKIAAGIIGAGLVSLIVFAVIILALDLGPVKEIKSSEEDARVIGEIAGYEVRYEELRYITLLYRAELDAEFGEYSTLDSSKKEDYKKALEEHVSDEIKNNYVILTLCDRYGIDTSSREVRKYVNDSIDDLVGEIGGKDEYREWLKENNLTDAFLRLIYKTEFLEGELLDELVRRGDEIKYSETNLDDFVDFVVNDDSYARTTHVFYPKEHRYIDVSNIKEKAISDLALIKGAEDDEQRKSLLDSCIGGNPVFQQETQFYFTYSQMPEEYERTAFSLDEYGVSELLELEDGYYIIMKLPKDAGEVAPRARMLLGQYRYAVLKQLCDSKKEDIEFVGNDIYRSLDLIKIE